MENSGVKKIIQNIFLEIDNAIETTISDIPVKLVNSKFFKKYKKIKRKYL